MWYESWIKAKLLKLFIKSRLISKTAIIERVDLVKISNTAEIKDYVIIRTYDNEVVIGDYTQINPFVVIYGHNKIAIGNKVMIGPHCMIASGNHDYKQVKIPMMNGGNLTKGPIVIGDDVWIGANSTILDGVKIGNGAVIGANSLVNRDIEPYSVVAGNPAKFIKYRK